jgi:hypothetical protein
MLPQFLTFNVHFARKCCGGPIKIAILLQFLTFNIHFVGKNCGGHLKIAILPRFWTSDVHEMLRLSRFVALRRHRPRLKREIERRAREDPQM